MHCHMWLHNFQNVGLCGAGFTVLADTTIALGTPYPCSTMVLHSTIVQWHVHVYSDKYNGYGLSKMWSPLGGFKWCVCTYHTCRWCWLCLMAILPFRVYTVQRGYHQWQHHPSWVDSALSCNMKYFNRHTLLFSICHTPVASQYNAFFSAIAQLLSIPVVTWCLPTLHHHPQTTVTVSRQLTGNGKRNKRKLDDEHTGVAPNVYRSDDATPLQHQSCDDKTPVAPSGAIFSLSSQPIS